MKNKLFKKMMSEKTDEKTLSDALSVKKDPVEPQIKKEETKTEDNSERKFFIMSSYGEILDLAIHLSEVEGEKVLFYVSDKEYSKIGDGILEKADNYIDYIGKGWTWIIDGCEQARLQDWLREKGEKVVGTNEAMAELEDNRQKGQEWFKKAGFKQPDSKNFKSIDDCLKHVHEHSDVRWVLKQNGSAPKSINHVGKFDDNSDMIYHLEDMKTKWNDQEFGAFDCDLMAFVDGVEVAASAFFNGNDWLRNKDGKVVGFLNFEEKKESDGNLGDTTGETGTTFFGCTEDNAIFADILLRPEITSKLKETKYQGVFDINGTLTDDGFIAFEPTSRFGIPATSYEFMEGIKTPVADLLCAMACGENTPIEVVEGWGIVIVVSGKPFPVEADMEKEATSIGEKLWLLKKGKPVDGWSPEHFKHIHLENFYCTEDGDYKVATKNGYLLVVSMTGKSIEDARSKAIEFIKDNLYISGNKYRQDIGARVEKHL